MFDARRSAVVLSLTLAVGAAGCATTQPQATCPPPAAKAQKAPAKTAPEKKAAPAQNALLDATLWQQTAAEHNAAASSIYHAAADNLKKAVADKSWVAAVEQTPADAKAKPPAIILDVDETVLDNSPYEARLIKTGGSFNPKTWNAWCNEAQADAIPGALALTQQAAKDGVTVFYVTNRDHALEDATRKNLAKLGFPLAEGKDVILTEHEQDGWTSDKTSRRKVIANNYRIIMLFGDNLGDFVAKADAQGTPAARAKVAQSYSKRWGTSWYMLPNPMYGYWEAAPYGYNYGASAAQKAKSKLDALNTDEQQPSVPDQADQAGNPKPTKAAEPAK